MHPFSHVMFPPPLAEMAVRHSGPQGFTLLAIVAVALLAAGLLGHWFGPPPPEEQPAAAAPAAPAEAGPPPEVFVVIAAAVAATLGRNARITAVHAAPPAASAAVMPQWSLEGRRQIYSSHQVR
jgi:hypothetical protein